MERDLGSVQLIGGFDFVARGGPVSLRGSGERLIAYLALHRGQIERHRLAGCFWGDKPDQRALGNLRAVLWRLPLGPDEPVQASGSRVGLAPEVNVDLDDVAAIITRVSGGEVRTGDSEVVGASAANDLLPGWYDDWVVDERCRYRQRLLHCLDAIVAECTLQRRFDEAIQAGLRSVSIEPLREVGHHALIRAHLAEGNRCEARKQYDLLDNLLRHELGVSPCPTITAEVQASLAA